MLLVEASTRYSVAVAEAEPHVRFTCVEETAVADKVVRAAGTTPGAGAGDSAEADLLGVEQVALRIGDLEIAVFVSPGTHGAGEIDDRPAAVGVPRFVILLEERGELRFEFRLDFGRGRVLITGEIGA